MSIYLLPGRAAAIALLTVFGVCSTAAPAVAQDAKDSESKEDDGGWLDDVGIGPLLGLEETEPTPADAGDPLADAFVRLASPDLASSSAARKEIEAAWSKSGSASIDLLVERAKLAMKSQNWEAAEEHLTQVVTLKPDYAQGWVLRAGARLGADKIGYALADITEALAREPRHYEAVAIASAIFFRVGRNEEALRLARHALSIYPHLVEAKRIVQSTSPEIDGIDI